MSEEAKKLQTEEINAENPSAEEEFEVSEDELEEAAGGRRIRGEVNPHGHAGRAGHRGGGSLDRKL